MSAPHPIERIAVSGLDAVSLQHRPGELSAVRGIGQHVRDDAVELKRLRRVAQGIDDGVPEPTLSAVLGYHCAPTLCELLMMSGQLCGRRRFWLRRGPAREVAALDGGQPDFLRPHGCAEHRTNAR